MDLSPRQRETLTLVAQGLPNKTIADRMGVTVGCVRQQLSKAYRRIGVGNRTAAAMWLRDQEAA